MHPALLLLSVALCSTAASSIPNGFQPLLTPILQPKLHRGNASEGYFAYAVSISADGSIMAMAAPADFQEGAVVMYARRASSWAVQQVLTVPHMLTSPGVIFGFSVALDATGTTLVVGAPSLGEQLMTSSKPGHALVYVQVGGEWSLESILTTPTEAPPSFGMACAISADGNRIGVAAPLNFFQMATIEPGTVSLFYRPAATATTPASWGLQHTFTAPSVEAGAMDMFGISLAFADGGKAIVVGAPGTSVDHMFMAGVVFVFTLSNAHAPALQTVVKAADASFADSFGTSIAVTLSPIAGRSLIAVGAPIKGKTASSLVRSGGVYVYEYEHASGAATLQATVMASDAFHEDYFGNSLALTPSLLVVGAPSKAFNSTPSQGKVYLFQLPAAAHAHLRALHASHTGAGGDVASSEVPLKGGAGTRNLLVKAALRSARFFGRGQPPVSAVLSNVANSVVVERRRLQGLQNDDALTSSSFSSWTSSGSSGWSTEDGSWGNWDDDGTWTGGDTNDDGTGTWNGGGGGNDDGTWIDDGPGVGGDDWIPVPPAGGGGDTIEPDWNSGPWYQVSSIALSDGKAYDWFGSAVAVSVSATFGTQLVIAAQNKTLASHPLPGAAYWSTLVAPATPPPGTTGSESATDAAPGASDTASVPVLGIVAGVLGGVGVLAVAGFVVARHGSALRRFGHGMASQTKPSKTVDREVLMTDTGGAADSAVVQLESITLSPHGDPTTLSGASV